MTEEKHQISNRKYMLLVHIKVGKISSNRNRENNILY